MALSRGNVDKQQFDPSEVEDDEGVTQAATDETETETAEAAQAEAQTEARSKSEPNEPDEQDLAPAPSQEVAPAPSQEVATRPASGAMVSGSLQDSAEEDGFGGLNFGFGSFPIVKLDDGVFVANDEEIGDSFTCVLQSSAKKILYRTIVGPDETPQLAYTYDDITTTKSENVADVIADWKRSGQKFTKKEYLDVTAIIQEDGNPFDGQVVILSVPPASVTRFSGYYGQLRLKGLSIRNVLTRVAKGKKITRAAQPFYPWEFRFVERLDEAA